MPTKIPINTKITTHVQTHISKLMQAHLTQGVVFLKKKSLFKSWNKI